MRYNILLLLIALCMGCGPRTQTNTKTTDKKEVKPIDFVMSDSLMPSNYIGSEWYFPSEGFVPTPDIAFKIAEPILTYIYGEETIVSEKPFSINLVNDIWIIEGSFNLPKGTTGGVAYMEIDKLSGQILKVIHGE